MSPIWYGSTRWTYLLTSVFHVIRGTQVQFESLCSQCRNGGYCLNVDSSSCTCEPGYSGVYCENRIPTNSRAQDDPCASQPCRNGGTCRLDRSAVQGYSCDCQLGFSGHNCLT
ncbi:jg20576, partial [Pararge aegeria aegeria]